MPGLHATQYESGSIHMVFWKKYHLTEDPHLIPKSTAHSGITGEEKKRASLTYYPQSNGRAEVAVKTAKQILIDSIDGYSQLHYDCAAKALLTHRNTPVQGLDMSPVV